MTSISIIIPCFNCRDYIKKCLDSLNAQSFQSFEVVLVDDCSTDDSFQLIESIKENYNFPVTVIKNPKNVGPSISRYNGVKASRSLYVSFCDSDDWYEPNYLEKMSNIINDTKCDVCFCNYKLVFGKKVKESNLFPKGINSLDSKNALSLDITSLCIMTISRHLFLSLEIPNIRNGEDMALIPVIISRAKKVHFIHDSLYNYYCRHNSSSLASNECVVKSLVCSFDYINKSTGFLYPIECEFIGIKIVLYGAVLNAFKLKNGKALSLPIIREFEGKYPTWFKNAYIKELPFYKRFFLFCVKKRAFSIIKFFSFLHNKILNTSH